MRSDRNGMPEHIGALVNASSKIDHTLNTARMIVQSPTCVEPVSVEMWPAEGFVDAASYASHRAKVNRAETQNAARLRTLVYTLTTLMDCLCHASGADQATRMTRAIELLGELLTSKWGIDYDEVPPRSGPQYVPLQQWAARRTLIPGALPLDQRNQQFETAREPARREYCGPPRWSST